MKWWPAGGITQAMVRSMARDGEIETIFNPAAAHITSYRLTDAGAAKLDAEKTAN